MKRRGAVEQLPDRTWRYRFSWRDATGRRHYVKRSGFTSRREAERAMTVHMVEADRGTGTVTTTTTVGDYLHAYYNRQLADRAWKPTYAATVGTHIRSYLVPRIGNVPIGKLTVATFDQLKADLLNNGKTGLMGTGGLSAKTVRNILSTLHKAFEDGVERQELSRHPMIGVKLPKFERPELVTYDETQVNRFLAYSKASNDYMYPLWRLMFATGLRRGELLGLRWVDVDFVSCRVNIVETIVEINGRGHVSTPKTRAGRRSFTIDTETRDALAVLLNAQEHAADQLGSWSSCRVATTLVGRPIHPRVLTRRFQAITAAAGLPLTRLHDGRHAAATMALSAGIPVHVVSRRLGHAKVSTTLDVYAQWLPTADERAADTIGQVLRQSALGDSWTPDLLTPTRPQQDPNDPNKTPNDQQRDETQQTDETGNTSTSGTSHNEHNVNNGGDDGTRTQANTDNAPARRHIVIRRAPKRPQE